MNSNKHLLLFTIGPVQSFISQARKTRDLYAGSWLLSELCRKAIEYLEKECSNYVHIIFPDKKIKALPNRILAEINSDSVKIIGEELEKDIRKEYKNLVIKTLFSNNSISPNINSLNEQIDQFLEIYWVALPFEEANYRNKFKEIESYLGAIKNIRPFEQSKEGEGRKCSLCGQRNALFFYSSHEEADIIFRNTGLKRNYFIPESVNLKNKGVAIVDISSGEGLCAICACKRFVHKKEGFPSTAEISLMNTLNGLSQTEKQLLEEYEQLFGKKLFDAQLYFEENLTADYFKRNEIPGNKLEKAKQLQKKITKKAKEKNLKLNKYYALLMLDGDRMGKWLSGDLLNNESELYAFHSNITEQLGLYADKVVKIIKDPKGQLVYAGGDDVLAFINLDYLFEILYKLRVHFPKFEEIASLKVREKSSPSTGIVIAHYKIPLSEVMKCAKRMEEKAKEGIGRNAFAVEVLKHSGEINECGFKWYVGLNDLPTIKIFTDIFNLINDEKIDKKVIHFSTNFIRQLRLEFSRLMTVEGKLIESQDQEISYSKLLEVEINRLLYRSLIKFTREKDEFKEQFELRKNQFINDLKEKILLLFDASNNDLENFLSTLEILAFISREANGGYNEPIK